MTKCCDRQFTPCPCSVTGWFPQVTLSYAARLVLPITSEFCCIGSHLSLLDWFLCDLWLFLLHWFSSGGSRALALYWWQGDGDACLLEDILPQGTLSAACHFPHILITWWQNGDDSTAYSLRNVPKPITPEASDVQTILQQTVATSGVPAWFRSLQCHRYRHHLFMLPLWLP